MFLLITNLTHSFNVFVSFLYTFLASQCSSSGESIVSIQKNYTEMRGQQNIKYDNVSVVAGGVLGGGAKFVFPNHPKDGTVTL
jgi:hypothetical protein